MLSDTVVELLDVNGEWWNLTEGDQGVWLSTGLSGIYEPPVKVVYEDPGNWPGSRYLNHRILRRDIVFGVEILHDEGDPWMSRDSRWRKAWAFDRDCRLYVTTEESGTRYLNLRLFESPDISLFNDPKGLTSNKAAMVCVAGDPFWYQDDVVYHVETTEDTTFDPNPLPWPWPQEELPTETLHIVVDPSDGKGGLNPTDQPVFLKWIVPGSTEAPALPYIPGIPWLGAPNSPAVTWTIPDYSFEDETLANRRLRLPSLIGGLRTNEVQKIYIDGRPTGGYFTLSYDGETTGHIAYNASGSTVKAALEALAGVVFNDIQVEQAPKTNEVQTIQLMGGATGGTYTLTLAGETTGPISHNASPLDMMIYLAGLAGVGFFDTFVTVTEANERQSVQVTGEPTAGNFTLTFDGHTTANIAYNASALDVYLALVALPNIDLFDILVNKDIFTPHSPYVIDFIGNLAGHTLNPISGDPSGLSGGAGCDVVTTTEIPGFRIYEVTFQGVLSGINLPEMTADPASLTGGVTPSVNIETSIDGSRPYICTFQNNLSGIDVPAMTVSTTGLTGGTPVARVDTTIEGHTYEAENAAIDTDPRVEQITAENGAPLWSRMNGVRFRHPVPPYTESKDFEITVSGTVPGQVVTLRIPRPWTRPWGLE